LLLEKASISYGHCALLYCHIEINKAAEAEEVGSRARSKTISTKELITDAKKPSRRYHPYGYMYMSLFTYMSPTKRPEAKRETG